MIVLLLMKLKIILEMHLIISHAIVIVCRVKEQLELYTK